MTREQLVKIGASKVRQNATLFASFKKFLLEDVEKVFPNGKLPSGCFGCQFQSNFAKWSRTVDQHSTQNKKEIKMETTQKTYELKNKHTRLFFSGKLLSNQSSDADWAEWITRPKSKELVDKRKEYFKTLPSSLVPKPKEEPKEDNKEPEKEPEKEVKQEEKPKRGRKKKS